MQLIQVINNTGDAIEQGDVVVIGQAQIPLHHGFDGNIVVPEVDLAQKIYDTRVCGIVCELQAYVKLEAIAEPGPDEQGGHADKEKPTETEPDKKRGEADTVYPQSFTTEELGSLDRTTVQSGQIGQVVIQGAFAHCKADADIAPIKVGDLLTTSPTKGHAQKVLDPTKAVGAILGKALGALAKGKGKIPVLVTLQ
jgi:hypothetical protein